MAAWSSASSSSSTSGLLAMVVRTAGLERAQQVPVLDQDVALVLRLARVELELGARVGDVEVAHRELADPVGRTEGSVLGALHRELVGVVGERRPVGAEQGVVLAAAQPQGHLTGDQRGDPALDRLPEHQRLRVQPAALVEQPAEPAALAVVAGDGVLVVDGVEQPLVGDPQQRHPRRLVDAARLGLDDPVLDLVRHAEPVAAADGVGLVDQVHHVVVLLAVDRDRAPGVEADADVLGEDLDRRVPELHAHDRLHRLQRHVEVLEGLGLVGGAPDVRVGGVGLLLAVAVGQPALGQPLAHLGATAELVHEVGVEPRLVDAQRRVGEQAVAVEPLDVVALERRAVAPDVHAVLVHRPHQHGAGDGATERRGVEVRAAAGADVEGTAGHRGQALLDQHRAAVHGAGQLGAVLQGALGDAVDVGLVVLADVGGVGAGHRTLLAHPGDRDGRVEPSGEGDADALAGGQGGQDLGHVEFLRVASGWVRKSSDPRRERVPGSPAPGSAGRGPARRRVVG